MPIYEYVCSNCNKVMDAFQKMNDPAPAKCEHCGAEGTLTRVVSRTSFVLKGGGWYSDLYGSSKGKDSGSKESSASSSEKSSSKESGAKESSGGDKSASASSSTSSSASGSAASSTSSSTPAKPKTAGGE